MQTCKNCFKERQFQLVEKPYMSFASGGFTPGPRTGHRPCTLVGASAAPRPPPSVGAFGPQCGLLSYILLLLQIFVTTLTNLKLESLSAIAPCNSYAYTQQQMLWCWPFVTCEIWFATFFPKTFFSLKNNTCDFKSNLHCMLIWFWNHAYICMISLDTQLTFHYIWFCS